MSFPLPDCPSCSAASTLEVQRSEAGTDYCACSCCGKPCWVRDGIAHPIERRTDVRDANGVVMYDP